MRSSARMSSSVPVMAASRRLRYRATGFNPRDVSPRWRWDRSYRKRRCREADPARPRPARAAPPSPPVRGPRALLSRGEKPHGRWRMSTIAFIKRGLDFAHRALADARNGTDAQLHFVPPNGSHSIAWCLWHTARVEDLIINARVLKRPTIWNEEWARRTGLPLEGLGAGQSD